MQTGLPIDVNRLLHEGEIESLRIEYKATWDEECGAAALRTICAFANDLSRVNGGYVVVGVEDDDGRPRLPVRGIPDEQVEPLQRRIRGEISRITPSYSPRIVPHRIEDRWILVLWCPAGNAGPYEAPEHHEKKPRKVAWVRTNSETRKAEGELRRQLEEVVTREPFDVRPRHDASTEDLSPDLVARFLREAGSSLAESDVSTLARYRGLDLLARTNSHEVPLNVALLFFNEAPRKWFPGARVEIAHYRDDGDTISERTFDGSLPTLVRESLDAIRSLPVVVQKHPDRAESDRIPAWPFAAVEEALVNAVHHRGYDVPDPIKVEVHQDRIRITSYPGPVAGLTLQDLDAPNPPRPPARNRRIAELLKDLRLAEARGSGLGKIRRAMAENGNPPPSFRFDEDTRTWFEVTLPIHPAFVPRDERALPLRVGRPAPAGEVIGREALIAKVFRALETHSVILLGPRGRGVSSVMNTVATVLDPARTVHLDMAGVTERGLVAAILARLGVPPGRSEKEGIAQALARTEHGPFFLLLDADPESESSVFIERTLAETCRALPHLRVVLAMPGTWAFDDDTFASWRRIATPIPIPPLSHADATRLANCLARGVGISMDSPTAFAIAEASAGQPDAIHRLVLHLHVEGSRGPDAVRLGMDLLLVDPADPTGLGARSKRVTHLATGTVVGDHATTRILKMLTQHPTGLRRLDIVAQAVASGLSRMDALQVLLALELDGWLVEVDDLVRFEHPAVREAWAARSPAPLPFSDDLPF